MWKKTAQFRSIFTTKINKANILLLIILVILNYHFPYHFSESTTSKQSNEKTVYSAPASQDKNPDEKNQAVAGINDSSIIDSDLDRAINLFSSAKVHTTAVNLLKSSSFETEVGGKPRGWFYLLDSNTANTYTSPEGNRSGASGLKFVGGGTGNFSIAQPDTKTVSGRTYTFSAHIKYSTVVFWPTIDDSSSRHDRLLLGK